ncbi:hypothetical protein [Isoptericola croceus]|uniref:hypothetical protein n=1 Tax=Isoptericola croceus TaxID=3031406 RepID=UPI0023F9E65D|nr:hypothetical protein [Isoptericola croceus]
MGAGVGALRLTDLLAAARLFAGPVPHLRDVPPAGPQVPHLVEVALRAVDPHVRAQVLDPLGRRRAVPSLGRPAPLLLPELFPAAPGGASAGARQVDATTCGAAVLVLLRLAGDPESALALARAPGGARQAFASMQRETHARTRRWWPQALGTPPWGAAREARYSSVRYTHRVVGARDPSQGPRGVLAAAVAAAAAGVPVPLYTGGDLRRGPAAAVPRHVVLLADVRDVAGRATVTLYEPSSGALHAMPTDALRGPGGGPRAERARLRALGGWPHVVWAVLPREAR